MQTAKIIFSDVNLTNKDANHSTRRILKDGSELIQELSSIGYCELGHAVITQGIPRETSHIIFVPIVNSQNPEDKIYTALFHQAIRSAFTLAKVYSVKDLIVELPSWKEEKTLYNVKPLGISLKKTVTPPLDRNSIKSIIDIISKEYSGIIIKVEYLP